MYFLLDGVQSRFSPSHTALGTSFSSEGEDTEYLGNVYMCLLFCLIETRTRELALLQDLECERCTADKTFLDLIQVSHLPTLFIFAYAKGLCESFLFAFLFILSQKF